MKKPAISCGRAAVGLIVAVVLGIHAQSLHSQLANAVAPANVPGVFVDTTAAANVNFTAIASHTSKKYLMETMGSGVALLDFDNDGLLDIFFVNGAPLS